MRIVRDQRGFTIIEVLIVLAVTAAMFLLAAYSIAGKQNTTEFQQAINDVQSSIQQSLNHVADGNYSDNGSFTCSAAPGGPLLIQAGTSDKGANGGCIFLGSALQFGVKDTNPQQYNIFTVAGVQENSDTSQVTSLSDAKPEVIAPSISTPNVPNALASSHLLDGLTAVSIKSGATNLSAVAFISSLSQDNLNTGGSQTIDLYAIPATDSSGHNATLSSSGGVDAATAAEVINENFLNNAYTKNPSQGVQICFKSAGTNQSGLINIGSNGRSLSVTLQIKAGTSC